MKAISFIRIRAGAGRRLLKWILAICAFTALLALVTGFSLNRLLATSTGSEWLVNKAVLSSDRLIQWDEMSGNLIDGLEISGLRVASDGIELHADRAVALWDFYGIFAGELIIASLEIRNLSIASVTSPESEPAPQSPLWPALSLPIAVEIVSSRIENLIYLQADSQQQIDQIFFSGKLNQSEIEIYQLEVSKAANQIGVTGTINAEPPYQMDIDLNWQTIAQDQLTLSGSASMTGNLIELQIQHSLSQPLAVSTSGSVQTGFDTQQLGLDPSNIRLNLSNSWALEDSLIPGTNTRISSAGDLRVEGIWSQLQLESQLDLFVPDISMLPEQRISFSANLAPSRLEFEQLSVDTEMGSVSATGILDLQQEPSWNFAIAANDINPEFVLSDWAGQLNAVIDHQGSWSDSGVSASAVVHSLNGSIRGYPVSASGQLSYLNGDYSVEQLVFNQGQNQLTLDASLNDQLSAEWLLLTENLSEIHPSLSGTLTSRGQASGTWEQPMLEASFAGQNLAASLPGAWELSAKAIEASFNVLDTGDNFLSLEVEELRAPDKDPIDLNLTGRGQLQEHIFEVTSSYQEITLTIGGQASYIDKIWQSELSSTNLQIADIGEWNLKDSSSLTLQSDSVQIDRLCLVDSATEICSRASYSSTAGFELSSQIVRFPISSLKIFLPVGAEYAGLISGDLLISGDANNLSGELRTSSDELILSVQAEEGVESYAFRNTALSAALSNDSVEISVASRLTDIGDIFGDISIAQPRTQKSLSGRLNAQFSDLSWIDPFFPDLTDMTGQTKISLDLGGTLSAPLISGDLNVENLNAYVPRLGIALQDGRLELLNRGQNSWLVEGQISSGDGSIQLTGDLRLVSSSEWLTQLSVEGSAFHLYESNGNSLDISPRLELQLSPERIVVEGGIEIPSGSIEIRALPATTLQVSRDEIIVGEDLQISNSVGQRQIYADINFILGKAIAFEGFDINGNLSGQVRLRERPDLPLQADGTLEITEGTYLAYGQELSIDPGRLIFNGTTDNPSLNIRATRSVGDNLVGVQIGGTARALSSSLFSSPAQSSTEIIAQLITGRPLSSATADDGALLVSAVTTLGLNQSSRVTERLQNTLGLDVATISSDENLQESVVTIGKYLSPKLFISYAQDILTPNASVSLDYSLSNFLQLNAKSGAVQSMDLFYRISR